MTTVLTTQQHFLGFCPIRFKLSLPLLGCHSRGEFDRVKMEGRVRCILALSWALERVQCVFLHHEVEPRRVHSPRHGSRESGLVKNSSRLLLGGESGVTGHKIIIFMLSNLLKSYGREKSSSWFSGNKAGLDPGSWQGWKRCWMEPQTQICQFSCYSAMIFFSLFLSFIIATFLIALGLFFCPWCS